VVHGQVTLVNVLGERRTKTLVNGPATFAPEWLHAGQRTFTVIYAGTWRVDPRTATKSLVVE